MCPSRELWSCDHSAPRGRWWWALRGKGIEKVHISKNQCTDLGLLLFCYSIKGYLPKIPLPSFHKIKVSLTPQKEGGHNLEDRAHLYKEQILFYERLFTLSFAGTFHPKLVKTLSWVSVGDHCVAEIPGSGLQVGWRQEDPQGRSSPWSHSGRSVL